MYCQRNMHYSLIKEIVPDHESRDRDLVLVRRTIHLWKPRGVGKLEWGGNGEGEVSLRATWDQGGQDSTMQRRDSK
jgi:hypothetical protein